MEIGKVPNDILKQLILGKIKNKRKEILIRPKVGEDCCAVDFGEYVCVLSSDPITGAVNEVGRLAVHISCNDVASCGVEPLGLLVTILAPPGTTEKELDKVMGDLCETADSLNVDIIGGHTEITSAVNRFVLITTAVGRILKEKLVSTSGARPGDALVLTKTAGLEGTAIIALDKEEELRNQIEKSLIARAKGFVKDISVVKEGIIAGEFGVSAMHDVTEGGVLGAVWEVAEASSLGVEVYFEKIPVDPATDAISKFYRINPLKLISSGCMIISCGDGIGLVERLKENGILATVIGKVTENKECRLVFNDHVEVINQPESDELYKVVG
ncbi:MAG: AIR synthase family protein [Clostridia bacterium]|nr:AIR synthase family protein [Clostridia bacterium]